MGMESLYSARLPPTAAAAAFHTGMVFKIMLNCSEHAGSLELGPSAVLTKAEPCTVLSFISVSSNNAACSHLEDLLIKMLPVIAKLRIVAL